ncbi:hypothetical protein R3P38DRAFT_3212277 [Favolaschia claudopus]|uniref:Uncharacterized protein n=1 Tax=Favolaschia claudopus TaxID=2862362 RepID=A0AAW0AEV2_9AGAR
MNIVDLPMQDMSSPPSFALPPEHPGTSSLPPSQRTLASLIFGIPGVDAHPYNPTSLPKAKRTPAFQRLLFPQPFPFKTPGSQPQYLFNLHTGEAFFPRRSDYQPCERSTRIKLAAAAPLERRMINEAFFCGYVYLYLPLPILIHSFSSSCVQRRPTFLDGSHLAPSNFFKPILTSPIPIPRRSVNRKRPSGSRISGAKATLGKPTPSQSDQAPAAYNPHNGRIDLSPPMLLAKADIRQ